MKNLSILFSLICTALLTGCSTLDNVTTTKFSYDATTGTTALEMPKEVEAKNLTITVDAKSGTAVLKADTWSSKNQGTLTAEAQREVAVVHEIVQGTANALGTAGGAALGSAAKAAVIPGVP